MALEAQLVPVQFGGGINTKVDPKQLQAGQLIGLQNAQFTKTGQLNKRFGYTTLNTTVEGGGQILTGVELAAYNDELILFDGNNLYSYLAATGNWSNRGTAISITTQDKDIIRLSQAQQLNPDFAYLNGIEVYAWEDSRGGVFYSVLDAQTKAFAVSGVQLNSIGAQPKCIAFQNQIFIFYTDGSDTLYYQTINSLNPTVVTAPLVIAIDGMDNTNGFPYDVSVIGNQLFVGYLGGSPNTGAIRLFYLSSGFVKSSTTVVNSTPGIAANAGYHGAINVCGDSNNDVWISWSNGLTIYTASYYYTLSSQILSSTLVDTANCTVLTGIESPTPLTLLLHYEILSNTSYNEITKIATISLSGTITPVSTIRSVGLASKAFTINNNIYITAAYQSPLQSTDFTFLISKQGTLLTTPTIIAKETSSVGGGLQTNGMCPEMVQISSGIFKFANLQAGKIISEANTLFTLLGVNSTELIFTPSDNFVNTTQENTLLIVGGILQGYDGVSTTELGFHLYPESIVAAISGAGSLSTGTYQYVVEFEWTDNYGQIYRSAPSIPVSIQVSSGQGVQLSGPTLRLTSKTTSISIVIYRTAANGTTFNQITSTISPLLNSTSTDSWVFTDILSDVSAQSNAAVYTTGNILANIAPPANSIISTFGDRVFLSGMSDPLLMWYSQSVVDNSNQNTIPPQFCAELTFSLDPRGGAITGLGLLNQILIIFKTSNIFSLQGNGPDATGNNSDYGDATLITSDVGCINGSSIVITPSGLMFQSNKGIYLLDQSLSLTYIGSPVELYNTYTITSAVLNATSNQVIFTTKQGLALVYDYYQQQWSTWTNHYAVDSTIYNNNFCYLTPFGQVFQQNTSLFTDNGNPIYMNFTTPNLSFAGLQGFQRVYKMFILGTYKGPHTLNVQVAYDFNDSYTQFVTVQPSANVSTWGSDAFWGTSSFWGGNYTLYEFRIDMQQQKCSSIRINISDNQASSYNEGYSISSLVFQVGITVGANRLPTTSTYGTT